MRATGRAEAEHATRPLSRMEVSEIRIGRSARQGGRHDAMARAPPRRQPADYRWQQRPELEVWIVGWCDSRWR
jgi:hypothetical protein